MRNTHKKEFKENESLCIDIENLLFPYEFFPLYEFQRMIMRKIKEIAPQTNENDIDVAELKTNKTKKYCFITPYWNTRLLRDKFPTITDLQLAKFLNSLPKNRLSEGIKAINLQKIKKKLLNTPSKINKTKKIWTSFLPDLE